MYTQKNRFGIVNREVITDPNLSIGAKTLYSVLSCDKKRKRTQVK